MKKPVNERQALLRIFWPSGEADPLALLPWHELRAALDPLATSPHLAGWAEWDRKRLDALLRLCEIYYPSQVEEPDRLDGVGDVVRRFGNRLRVNNERVVFVACLDAAKCVVHEVLAVYGGPVLKAPSAKALLRHALHKGAHAIYVVDFRPVIQAEVYAHTARVYQALRQVGRAVGLDVKDWALIGPGGMLSLAETLGGAGEAERAA